MKTISKLKSVLVLMVFAAAIFSCSDSNETDYTGVNSIYVISTCKCKRPF